MASELRSAESANPDENRSDAEIILINLQLSSYTNPALSCDSSIR
jgi:hypothetical protein